jgi:hypothetical protein
MSDELAGSGRVRAEELLRSRFGVPLADVLSLVDYLREPSDYAVLAGSVAVGLGNSRSDLDIIVVGGRQEYSAALPLTHFIEGVRVDVWKLDRAQIAVLAGRARDIIAQEIPVSGILTQSDVRILQRLAYGLVIDGTPCASLHDNDARVIVSALCTKYFAEIARLSALATHLSALTDDPFAAAWNARQCLDAATEAGLARRGSPFIGSKWLYHRVREASPEWWNELRELVVLPGGPEGGDTGSYVLRCLSGAAGYLGEPLDYDAVAARLAWVRREGLELRTLSGKFLLLDTKQFAVAELSASERLWCQECLGGEDGRGPIHRVSETARERLAFMAELWRGGLIEVEPAASGGS